MAQWSFKEQRKIDRAGRGFGGFGNYRRSFEAIDCGGCKDGAAVGCFS
jgi:hypothetical protein